MRTIALNLYGLFGTCWRGHAQLWKAFWLIAVAGKFVVLALLGLVTFALWSVGASGLFFDALSVLLLIGYVGFSFVCVWRCARNTNTPVLGGLARVMVVFGALAWGIGLVRAL